MCKEDILNYLQQIEYLSFTEEFSSYTMDEELEATLLQAKQEGLFPIAFSIANGVSKAVILVKGLSEVIKVPFKGRYDQDMYDTDMEVYEDDLQEATKKGEEALKAFQCNNPEPRVEDYYMPHECATEYYETQCGKEYWDYCKFETEIYEAAYEDGLAPYFAEERLLGYVNGHPIYYQVRCTPMEDMNIDYSSPKALKMKETSKDICKKHQCDCFNPIWIADFIEYYGEEEFIKLNQFLCDHDIQDLRESNIGYLDGAPILFDYTGYREW